MNKHNCKMGIPLGAVANAKSGKIIYVPSANIMLCTVQRAASTSMHESLGPNDDKNDNRYLTPAEAFEKRAEGIPAMMWLRDPFERFASAYAIFGKRFCCAESFATHALQTYNPHWSPQLDVHAYGRKCLPNQVASFNNLAEDWPQVFPDFPLQARNLSSNKVRRKDESGKVVRGRMPWSMLSQMLTEKTIDTLTCRHMVEIECIKAIERSNSYVSVYC